MIDTNCEMDVIQMSEERTECDNVTALELQRTRRILHFSDGTMEELSESDGEDVGPDITDKSMELNIDVKTLPLASRVKYQAYYASAKFLNAIDYVGGGLASFLGITTPKYVSESDIDTTAFHQQGYGEEGNGTWRQDNNNTTNAVITRCPSNVVSNYP